ncbi:MAG: PAS domain S-box-containing protein [Gammaproteobacteria bacterium]|jgi:PAS domain S-box-containing protein
MQFELWQLFLVSVSYLGILFVIATITDRGWLPDSLVRNPWVYTLSIGVYATSWSFYGSVGFAESQGFNFLTIYLGPTIAFIAAPILLSPILKITETYRLASLSDLFAFRYRSQFAGVAVTVLILAGTLPYISLQIQAVTKTLQIMTGETETLLIALVFCLTIALFSILFGARHTSLREKHEGLVVAIAFESLVKLITLMIVGLFAIFGIFDGLDGLNKFLTENPEATSQLFKPVREGPWFTLLILSFAAAFLLPRQFHMVFVENINSKNIHVASWAFPLFLLLLNISIPAILWAGQSLKLDMSADFYVLGITLSSGSTILPVLTFLGGLSAASAMIIVTTLALSTMCMNHLVLPASFTHGSSIKINMYDWLIWGRRIVILLIIAAGFFFYLALQDSHGLVGLGLISFVAVAQCLPGIVGLLYWPRANKSGFVAGLLTGGTIWAFTSFIPLFERAGILQTATINIPDIPLSTTDSAMWSLLLNSLMFVVVSLLSRQSEEERDIAEACTRVSFPMLTNQVQATSLYEFEYQLAEVIGDEVAISEVKRALVDLNLKRDQITLEELPLLHAQIDRNMSGLVGPVLARMILSKQMQLDSVTKTAIADTIQFIEHQQEQTEIELRDVSGELDALRQFHTDVLQDLPLGVVAVAHNNEISGWNKSMTQITSLEQDQVLGISVVELPVPWNKLLESFLRSNQFHLVKHKMTDHSGSTRVLNLFKAAVNDSEKYDKGMAIIIEDFSEQYSLEEHLAHSQRLASIGQLATGVAHEIGNPVTGIACLAQDLQNDSDQNNEINEGLKQILTQTERITRIVSSLSNFAYSGAPLSHPAETVKIRDIVEQAINLVSLSSSGKQMHYHNFCREQFMVAGYPHKLIQVFVNLLTNATDASEQGQNIRISTHEKADTLMIEVEDNGLGMDDSVMSRVFEPFFTTKNVGDGTGLGLSLVYSILREHGGSIQVESSLGKGCRFTIELPTVKAN